MWRLSNGGWRDRSLLAYSYGVFSTATQRIRPFSRDAERSASRQPILPSPFSTATSDSTQKKRAPLRIRRGR